MEFASNQLIAGAVKLAWQIWDFERAAQEAKEVHIRSMWEGEKKELYECGS